jgi:hypothetical protein
MEAAKAKNWAVEPQEKKKYIYIYIYYINMYIQCLILFLVFQDILLVQKSMTIAWGKIVFHTDNLRLEKYIRKIVFSIQ